VVKSFHLVNIEDRARGLKKADEGLLDFVQDVVNTNLALVKMYKMGLVGRV
jgi:hypothetical protein